MIGNKVPVMDFTFREGGEFVSRSDKDLFNDKRVVLISSPGAFTPISSSRRLPEFERWYNEICLYGVDDVYCVTTNDPFVCNAWSDDQQLENILVIPDGNGSFTRLMGREVTSIENGLGFHSWPYVAIINNGIIEQWFEEPDIKDEGGQEQYSETALSTVISYLKSTIS